MTATARSRRRRRTAALLLGPGSLLIIEIALRLVGFGAPGHRPDPFAGFSPQEKLFVRDVDDDGVAWYRTRDDRVGAFRPARFTEKKPARTVRFFCLGGSSTYGFPLAAEKAFCPLLGEALAAAHPGHAVEAINCGGMSYGSRRVLNIMREVVDYRPDAVIVYMGHNEYLERRFFAPFLTESAWRRSLRGHLNQVRIYTALRRLLAPLTRTAARPDTGLFGVGPARDDSRRVPRDPEEDALIERRFRFVVEEMSALARSRNIPLLLVRPGANLRGWAPEASEWRAGLPPDLQQERSGATARARAAHQRGDEAAALAAVNKALAIDPTAAEILFLQAQILESLHRLDEARDAYRVARDRDGVPIRITSALGAIISRAWGDEHLLHLDAAGELATASPDGIVGNEMILDYCHPTAAGHRRIAGLLYTALQATLWPDQPAGHLDPSIWDRPEPNTSSSAFGTAWQGQMLLRQGRVAEALPLFRQAVARDPELATAQEGLGRTLVMTGAVDEGVRHLERATRLDPEAGLGWNNLGLAYVVAGRLPDAVAAFRTAVATGVGTGVSRKNLADVLLRSGQLDEARREIEAALAASPASSAAWTTRGRIAEQQGDRTAAVEAYRRALDLDPGATPAADGLARLGAGPR
ncbi:MAG: tetratricopeptide repeat protein [Acidobacteriota bacterium]